MNNETQIQIIILIIIIILIKHFEFEQSLFASYSTEQEEEDSNVLFLNLLNLQLNREEITNLKKLNRLISQYWFNEYV